MDLPDKLKQLIDEYFGEDNKQNIQCISINIPGHKGFFFILDSFKLTLKNSESFSLSIFLSCDHRTKQGRIFTGSINKSDRLNSFLLRKDRKGVMYFMDFGDNKEAIIENVAYIIQILFPYVDAKNIQIEMKRISDWYTID